MKKLAIFIITLLIAFAFVANKATLAATQCELVEEQVCETVEHE